MTRNLKLDSIAGQIRDTLADLDRLVTQLREACRDDDITELAVRALGEARKHLQIAHEIVHIPAVQP